MKMYSKFLALLLLLTLSFGCNKDDDDMDCSTTQLANTEWQVVIFEENDSFIEPITPYTLKFTSTSFTLSLDVNTCGGNVDICEGDQLINFLEAGCTEACCDSDFALLITEFLVNDVISFELNNDRLRLLSNSVLDKRLTLAKD